MPFRHQTTILVLLAASACVPAPAAAAPPEGDAAGITLGEAVAAALRNNPELEAAGHAVDGRAARARQAGLLPNPEVRLEAENIGGSGDFAGVESAESTLWLSQRLELGGKRDARVAVAAREHEVATTDLALRRAGLAARATQAFVAVLAAQAQLLLAERLGALHDRAVARVAGHVAAGAAPEADVLRARLVRDEAALLRRRREQELAAARADLEALWSGAGPPFSRASGDLTAVPPPALAALLDRVADAPELARWQGEVATRAAAVSLQRAQAVPDVLLTAGPRYFSDTGDVALVAEVALPLPVFDRNQGAIDEARAQLAAGEADQRAAALALRAAVMRAHAAWSAAWAQATALRERLLPAAEQVLASSRRAYDRGVLRLDELHDAQRALVELHGREIEALAGCNLARAELARLLGDEVHP
jgi:cobalt-zinc-cadmium efflux system outer membrane protein